MGRLIDADELAKAYMVKGKDKLRISTMIEKRNPCDVCERCPHCGGYCANSLCFVNHEGFCLLSLHDVCGAWKELEWGW